MWTERRSSGVAVELGAEWIGNEGAVHDRLARAGARLVEARGLQMRRLDGGWHNLSDLSSLNRDLVQRASRFHGPDRSLLTALDSCCAGPETAESRAHVLRYVQGFHAADPARLSTRWLADMETNQPAEASDLRAPDGVGRVVEALSSGLEGRCDIRLGTVAREVRWRPGHVEIRTSNGTTLRAAAAVISVRFRCSTRCRTRSPRCGSPPRSPRSSMRHDSSRWDRSSSSCSVSGIRSGERSGRSTGCSSCTTTISPFPPGGRPPIPAFQSSPGGPADRTRRAWPAWRSGSCWISPSDRWPTPWACLAVTWTQGWSTTTSTTGDPIRSRGGRTAMSASGGSRPTGRWRSRWPAPCTSPARRPAGRG